MGDKLLTIRVAEEMEPLHCETRRFRRPTKSGSPAYYYAFYETDIVSVEDAPMEEPPQGSVVLDKSAGGDVYHRVNGYVGDSTSYRWVRTGSGERYSWHEIISVAGGEQNLKVLDIS